MELRKKFLRFLYPLTNAVTKALGVKSAVHKGSAVAPKSFYDLKATLNNGEVFPFEKLRSKQTLIVNTATGCGYTAQLKEMVLLKEKFPQLEILAFPSNDFKDQESGSDAEIASFCEINYNYTLPLFQKSKVIGNDKHEVFEWLSNPALNGWNDKAPVWNFSKYLVDEKGNLTHVFETAIAPLDKAIINAISKTS